MRKSPRIQGIDLVWLPVQDMARAIDFYQERLGLTLQYSSQVWAEFLSPTATHLALWLKPDVLPCPGRIFLAVDNCAEAAEQLRESGIEIVFGPQTYFYGDVLEFKDSEGNIVGLYKRTERS